MEKDVEIMSFLTFAENHTHNFCVVHESVMPGKKMLFRA